MIAPDAATRATWGDKPPPRQPKLKRWTPLHSGALRGFVSIELASGLVIHKLRIIAGKNGLWVAMPAEWQLERDGQPRIGADGKALYNQILEFRDRATSDRFAAMVIEIVRQAHPGRALG
jgi:SpoVG